MTEQSFIDTDTGTPVTARQAQHPGQLLLCGDQNFEDGDWIVRMPIGFSGIQEFLVFSPELFKRRFKIDKVVKPVKLTWDNYLDQVGFVPKKRRVVR